MYKVPATLYTEICTIVRGGPARPTGPARPNPWRGRPAHPLGRAQSAQQHPHPPLAATSRLLRPPPMRPGLCACSAERGGAPTPPRDRCDPSRAPPARPSPTQLQCPVPRPSQPCRQPAGSSTRPRRASSAWRTSRGGRPRGRHFGRRRSAPPAPPRLAVARALETSLGTNTTLAASPASSSKKAGEPPTRNTR